MNHFKEYYQIILNIDNDKIEGLNNFTNNNFTNNNSLTNENIVKLISQIRDSYINKCIQLLEDNYNLQNSVEGNSFLKLILYPLINI